MEASDQNKERQIEHSIAVGRFQGNLGRVIASHMANQPRLTGPQYPNQTNQHRHWQTNNLPNYHSQSNMPYYDPNNASSMPGQSRGHGQTDPNEIIPHNNPNNDSNYGGDEEY